MKKGHVSVPAKEKIKGPPGSVARLVDRLLQQDPQAQVRFATGSNDRAREFMSVYSDDKGNVWIDIE